MGSIGTTALVLTPWNDPVPLRRAWCLWEIYSTLSEDATLSVCMSDEQNANFQRALVDDVDAVITALCTIDAEAAEAGSQKDLEMIFSAVRTLDGGFHTLNATVMEQMRGWLMECNSRALASFGLQFMPLPVKYVLCCAASGDRDDWRSFIKTTFEQPCDCDDQGTDDRRITPGNWYRKGAGTKEDCSICAQHWAELPPVQQTKWTAINCPADLGEDAELFSEVTYELIGEVFGGPEAEANAASLLLAANRLCGELETIDSIAWNEAAATRKALALREKLFGRRDVRTSEAILETSKAWEVEDDEEWELLMECFEIRAELLPANDIQIGQCLKFLGRFMSENCEDSQAALPFVWRSVAIFEHHDPDGRDVDTLSVINELAMLLDDVGRVAEARLYAQRAFQLSFRWQGERHHETATMANNLAVLILSEFVQEVLSAVPLARLNLKTVSVLQGVDSVEAAQGKKMLADCLIDSVKVCARTESVLRVGDRVRLLDDLAAIRELAQKHGGWDRSKDGLCGQTGTVKRTNADGTEVWILFDSLRRPPSIKKDKHSAMGYYRINSKAVHLIERTSNPVGCEVLETPRLSTLMHAGRWTELGRWTVDKDVGWVGTEAEAARCIEAEAEALLVEALAILEAEVGGIESTGSSARTAAKLLCDLYVRQGREKEADTVRHRKAKLEAWCSSSESDVSSEDGSDSEDEGRQEQKPDEDQEEQEDSEDETQESQEQEQDVQILLLRATPQLAHALMGDNDDLVSVVDLESALKYLHRINDQHPAKSRSARDDRAETERALVERIKVATRRDRALALLAPLCVNEAPDGGEVVNRTVVVPAVSEGTPPPSKRRTISGGDRMQVLQQETQMLQLQPTASSLHADMAALSIAVENASPPSHAFGRTATTGQSPEGRSAMQEEDRLFDTLLVSLGLQGYATALRAQAIVTAEELQDLTDREMESLGMTIGDRARIVDWAAARRPV